MAIIEKFDSIEYSDIILTRQTKTRAIVKIDKHDKCFQINTYGSINREDTDKVSQTISFSGESLNELKKILSNL